MEDKIFTKEEREEWTSKLQPYWDSFWKVEKEFREKISLIEQKMNNEIKPFVPLNFFWCDGECSGIGAENMKDRDNFPLLHFTEFDFPDEEV